MATSTEQARKDYVEFEEKVKRTVYIDNLSPRVTASVIRTALAQFANVKNVEFIQNFTVPYDIPQCALVEVESSKQVKTVITMMTDYPFMMSGMPRPVKAHTAKAEMFADRPAPPDRKIQVRWVNREDPEFEAAKKQKQLYKKHTVEHLAMIKLQLEEEGRLAKQQEEMLKVNYKKFELIEGLMDEGTAKRLARHYGICMSDD